MLKGRCHCGNVYWTLTGDPGSITACNCTLRRRYSVLWIFDYENERIRVAGATATWMRAGKTDPALDPFLPKLRVCDVLARVAGRG